MSQSAPNGPGGSEPSAPWSPFPVQNWSELPADPLAPPWGEPNPADRVSAPPPRRRRGWLPVAVITVLGLLIAGAAYVTTSVTGKPPLAAAARFLPADGAASYARVETTRELATTTATEVTESALLSGYTGLLSTDTTFGVKALSPVYDQGQTIRLWRTISTTLDDPASGPAGEPATTQTTRIYRTNDGIELLGESGPAGGYAYHPALVELPGDVAAGSTWTSAGSAGDTLDYRAELRASGDPGGCLAVTGLVHYANKQGQQQRVVGVERTWCPGEGITASTSSFGSTAQRSVRTEPPTGWQIATNDSAIRWTDPQRWVAATADTVSGNPTYGEGPMSGSSLTSVTPVRTRSGLVVRAMAAPTDLIATTRKDVRTWTTSWRAHPGGSILSLGAFGNVVVVTTSDRRIVGYSDRGARLWQIDLDELAPTAPLRVSDTHAVLVDLSGDVRRFALATGAQDWQRNVGSDVSVAPSVGAGLVVVADRSATVTALDATTGVSRWTQQLDASVTAVVGDSVVVVQDQTAHGLAASSGDHHWLRHYDGTVARLVPFGDQLVLATSIGSVLIDREGRVRTNLGGFLDLTVTPDLMVGWGKNQAELFDQSGKVVSRWDIPSITVVSEVRPGLATPDGVLLFNLDWTFGAWTLA